jgi:tetratricopeptide (TPR) repeat protein
MRLFLILVLISLFPNAYAQCELKEFRKEIRDARKQLTPENYEMLLLHMRDSSIYSEHCKQAIIKEAISNYYYDTDVDMSIQYRDGAGQSYAAAGDRVRANFCMQNIGFAFEERKNDMVNARRYIDRALKEWEKLNDTTQQANLNKYIGLLEGKTGKYASGKEYVHKAIAQFKSVDNSSGVAVCYFDMGIIYFEETRFDSAIAYFNKANAYWKEIGNSDRIFGINNYLLRTYGKMQDNVNASKLIADNEAMLGEKTYWEDRLKFYKYAGSYQPAYEIKHQAMRDSLLKAGIKVD